MTPTLTMPEADDPITLKEASELHFSGLVSVASLMDDVKLGRLSAFKIGYTTLTTGKAVEDLKITRDLSGGAVYVVGFNQYIKIGFSRNLLKRIAKIQEYSPEKLTVHAKFPGSIRDEILLHRRFQEYRLNGEWFRHEGELKTWIEGGCQ